MVVCCEYSDLISAEGRGPSPGCYSVQRIAEGSMATEDPFNDPAIRAQIQADVARIEADWFKWHSEPSSGDFHDKIIERLVAKLDAGARGYLNAVNTESRIA